MPKMFWLYLAILFGSLGGLGVYTFMYAEGLSYFSSDPRACVNCHIMRKEYDSWQKSSHHSAATCVQCHLPVKLVPKLIAKAENGYHHSKGFTFQDFHEPIMIKEKNARILQENCIYCHGAFVHDVLRTTRESISCTHCHQGVGHGPRSN